MQMKRWQTFSLVPLLSLVSFHPDLLAKGTNQGEGKRLEVRLDEALQNLKNQRETLLTANTEFAMALLAVSADPKDPSKHTAVSTKLDALDHAKEKLAAIESEVEQLRLEVASKKNFLGFDFGIGFSVSATLDEKRIESAELDPNGIVRVTKESRAQPRILLETHFFFEPETKFLGKVHPDEWGHGPFVAIQGSDKEVIEAFGAGWMVGLKPKNDQSYGFNVGLGLILDPAVTVLGDGIVENQPLPSGETVVRLKEENQISAFLSVSFSWD